MSLPTLTPKQTQSTVVLPESYTPPEYVAKDDPSYDTSDWKALVSTFPFGTYANEDYWFDGGNPDAEAVKSFMSGSADQVAYTYRKLGGDVLDIEITVGNVYAAYEEAVLEYSYHINKHQAKNVLGSLLGFATGTFDHDGQMTGGDASGCPEQGRLSGDPGGHG